MNDFFIVSIFLLGMFFLFTALVLSILFKKEDYSAKALLYRGSYLYRELDKFVQTRAIFPVKVFAWTGIFFLYISGISYVVSIY